MKGAFLLAAFLVVSLSAPSALADACDAAGLQGPHLESCKSALKRCQYSRGLAKTTCIAKAVDRAKRDAARDAEEAKRSEKAQPAPTRKAEGGGGDAGRPQTCEEAGLTDPYLGWCRDAWARCEHERASKREECFRRVVRQHKDRADRAAAREAEKKAAQEKYALCRTEEYEAACWELQRRLSDICIPSRNAPTFAYGDRKAQSEDARRWLQKYRDYEAMIPAMDDFNARYGKCRDAHPSETNCSWAASEEKQCREAKGNLIAAWKQYVDQFEEEGLAVMDREIEKLRKVKGATTTAQNWTVEGRLNEIVLIQMVNDSVEWLQVDPKRVADLRAAAQERFDTVEAIFEAAIADVSCPKPSNPNPGLTGKLRKVLAAHGKETKDPDSTLEETVKVFGLTGNPTQKRVVLERVVHEDVPGVMCVEQRRPEQKPQCRIFQMTFRRTKPDGGSWGDWRFYSIGGGQLMNCAKL